jgi:hypothetical protein
VAGDTPFARQGVEMLIDMIVLDKNIVNTKD